MSRIESLNSRNDRRSRRAALKTHANASRFLNATTPREAFGLRVIDHRFGNRGSWEGGAFFIRNPLAGRRKSDPEKVKIGLRLRRESIMTLKWIAQRLPMGSWTNVSNCLANESK
jgi:hypothetical protein